MATGRNWSDGLGVAVATGAASGVLAASGVGMVGSIAGNAAISMAGNAADQVIKNGGFENFDVDDMLMDGAIGGLSGVIGGKGANGKNLRGIYKRSTEVLKTAVSPKKIAMYTAKKVIVKQKAMVAVGRNFAAGAVPVMWQVIEHKVA